MVEVLDLFTESKEFSGLVKNVESGMEKNYVLGLSTSQKALYISGIFRQSKRQLIVVVEKPKRSGITAFRLDSFRGQELYICISRDGTDGIRRGGHGGGHSTITSEGHKRPHR